MSGYVFAVVLSAVFLVTLFSLLRARRLREKYAGIWVTVGAAVLVVAVFPRLAFWLADLVGVETPVNLLFAVALIVVLVVCIQLSSELSRSEEQTRTLAEEIALLRLEVRSAHGAPLAPHCPHDSPDEPAGPHAQG